MLFSIKWYYSTNVMCKIEPISVRSNTVPTTAAMNTGRININVHIKAWFVARDTGKRISIPMLLARPMRNSHIVLT